MKFGAPPPAPPPPAPPAPPPPPTHQVYLVFFDWDKYNITPEGMQIIQLAANQYKSGGRVTLQVTGYTDTSGSPGYNQRLSERRANAVGSRARTPRCSAQRHGGRRPRRERSARADAGRRTRAAEPPRGDRLPVTRSPRLQIPGARGAAPGNCRGGYVKAVTDVQFTCRFGRRLLLQAPKSAGPAIALAASSLARGIQNRPGLLEGPRVGIRHVGEAPPLRFGSGERRGGSHDRLQV